MVLTDDVETQKKGIVLVSWTVGNRNTQISENEIESSKLGVWSMVKLAMTAVPARHEAIHFCYDNLIFAPLFALVKVSLSLYLRIRVRSHYGNKADCLRKLRTFGIPTNTLPLKTSELDGIQEIWKKRRTYETEEKYKSKISVMVPGSLDVLLGRGRRCQEHVGNMRLRILVEDCKPVYDNASRKEKTLISQEIVDSVKKNGHRFLKDEGGGWIEVDGHVARLKVSHTFRDVIKSGDASVTDDTSTTSLKRERS